MQMPKLWTNILGWQATSSQSSLIQGKTLAAPEAEMENHSCFLKLLGPFLSKGTFKNINQCFNPRYINKTKHKTKQNTKNKTNRSLLHPQSQLRARRFSMKAPGHWNFLPSWPKIVQIWWPSRHVTKDTYLVTILERAEHILPKTMRLWKKTAL